MLAVAHHGEMGVGDKLQSVFLVRWFRVVVGDINDPVTRQGWLHPEWS